MLKYIDSGVDISAGEAAVARIKNLAKATADSQVLTGIGSFGGLFKPDLTGVESPVLVSSCDGVGTKLKVAFMAGKHDTVGQDIVNHCVNDILVHGARALFFLDYIATGKLVPDIIEQVVGGVSIACKEGGLALIGGETAEMPEFYAAGEYDLVGTIVGMVDQKKLVTGERIAPGDVCIGLPSTGLHTNGYTLARKVAFDVAGLKIDSYVPELSATIGEALLTVHRSYAQAVHRLAQEHDIHGMAHITGSGHLGNMKRILPDNVDAHIDVSSWPTPAIFEFLREAGNLDPRDMYFAFNMGLGYIMVVPAAQAESAMTQLKELGETPFKVGYMSKGTGTVKLVNMPQ